MQIDIRAGHQNLRCASHPLELLKAATDNTPGRLGEVATKSATTLLVAENLRETPNAGALADVQTTGESGCETDARTTSGNAC